MAFISSAKHSRGNKEVNTASVSTASVSTASTNVPTTSANIGVASISQDTAYAYIASQSSGSQIKFEDINQIDEDDIEEIDIKWYMALLSTRADRAPRSQDRGRRDNYKQGSKVEEYAPKALMAIDGVGWDWSYMANDEENHALIADEEIPTKFALMAKTSAESEVFDNSLCSKACKKNSNSLNSKITELTDKLYDAKNMTYHYKLALAQVESRLAEHRSRELKYCEKIRVLEFNTESRANCIESLTKDLEFLKKEKGELETKLIGFQTASKVLDSLLESQRLDKNNEGLGYSDVPPPSAQIYSPPNKDMSWTGLPKCADDIVTGYSRPAPTIESSSDDAQNRNPSVTETEASPSTISPKPFIKFVKVNDSPTKSKTDKVKTAKKPLLSGSWAKNNNTHKGSSQNNIDDKGYWDSGCSRYMTGNISYLSDYEPFDVGYMSFGQGGCKITGKGTIKTDKLEFENVYFVKDLKYNLFSVSQICDNKNSVLFTDSKCIVLERDFKLLDDANMLLRIPRQHNMYSIDLNNIVPHKDLTCLVAKASVDEGILWHMRLGHLNFKIMNRLVRHNLVRGLPYKCFENDHTCTACLKGKQHKASCKSNSKLCN
nr:ribonuclease H-like domain-containing protein [Tanacetum cinerariifolium]